MSNHPLHFFKDLIENPVSILRIERKFYEENEEFSLVLERNKEEGYIISIDPFDDEGHKTYFKDYIRRTCQQEKMDFINNLDSYLLGEKEPNVSNDYLHKIIFELNYFIIQFQNRNWNNKYPFILEIITSIKDHLHSKYDLVDNTVSISNKKIINPKIQWLGKTNVLTTLFYDLLNGQDKGEPYIHANKKDIMQFLIDNFLDKNGAELSENTVQSYFDKQDKKAKIGDRIELPNKRVIK